MRTWDENRVAINGLWPLMEFSAEEKRLWHDDLSGLNQDVLYDAIRNVKRNNDTNYPQLKWLRDEYRVLERLRNFSTTTKTPDGEPRKTVKIDAASDARMRDELRAVIESATPSQTDEIVDLIAGKAHDLKIEMATAYRLVKYLLERLGLNNGGQIGDAT